MWSLIKTGLWLTSIAAPLLLLAIIWKRKIHRSAPAFAAFVALLFVHDTSLFLFHLFWTHNYKAYFYAYWAFELLLVALRFVVVREVFQSVMANYQRFAARARRVFVWTVMGLLAFGVATASMHRASNMARIVVTILTLRRSALVLEAGLLVVLIALAAFFGLSWRSSAFGIGIGLAVYGVLQLAVVTLEESVGYGSRAALLSNAASYLCAMAVWIAYCSAADRPTRAPDTSEAFAALEMHERVLKVIGP